jgi:hypothetical protein
MMNGGAVGMAASCANLAVRLFKFINHYLDPC